MAQRRYLFIPPRPRAGLSPIYLALITLALASAIGFASALWRGEPPPAPSPMQRSSDAVAPKGGESIDRVTRPGPEPRRHGRWM